MKSGATFQISALARLRVGFLYRRPRHIAHKTGRAQRISKHFQKTDPVSLRERAWIWTFAPPLRETLFCNVPP